MKPVQRGISWKLNGALDLHIDEIEAVCAAFRKVAARIEIQTPGYEEITAPAELTGTDTGLQSLTVLGFNDDTPDIGFEFVSGSVKIWTAHDRPALRGALDEARDAVAKAYAPQSWRDVVVSPVFATAVLFGPALLLMMALEGREWLGLGVGLIVGLAFGPRALRQYQAWITRRYTVIRNILREPHPSFWQRNREVIARDLLIGIGVAVVSIILTVALLD